MFENAKEKLADKNRERHEKRCAAGKHDWYLSSSSTIEYSYSSVGGCNPTYSESVYMCRWCDAVDIRTEGDRDEYLNATGDSEQ